METPVFIHKDTLLPMTQVGIVKRQALSLVVYSPADPAKVVAHLDFETVSATTRAFRALAAAFGGPVKEFE